MNDIHQVVRDCINALSQLRSLADEMPLDGEALRRSMMEVIDALKEKAHDAGISQRDSDEIQYAIVAVADEFALHKGAQLRELWMRRPLQLHYFNENIAGEGFFSRLENLIGDARREGILRVYYLCLLIGFEGRYASSGSRLELEDIRSKARRALGDWVSPNTISHQPLAPREPARPRKRNFPAIAISVMLALFSVSLVYSLWSAIGTQSDGLINDLKQIGSK